MNPSSRGIDSSTQLIASQLRLTAPEEVLGCEPEVAEEVGTDSEGEEVPHVAVDYDAV